jgi:adenosylhomocysteine nucleosidase
MDVEAAPFLEALAPGAATREVGALGRRRQSFTAGELDGSTVLVVTAGIGLANAAAAAARALMMVDPGIVIAAGTTGGLGREVEVGDVIAATTFSSADATAFGYARGQIPQMPVDHRSDELTVRRAVDLGHRVGQTVRVGQVLSSDSFVTAANVGTTREEFPDALATDMETAAMAQVSWSVGVDWVSLRAVSDLCGPRADQDFHMDSARAARLSYQAVRAFLSL